MSILQFFDDSIAHLAWPIVALVAIIMFRDVLRIKIDDIADADVSIGKWHFILSFRERRKTKAELGYVGADLSSTNDISNAASPLQASHTSIERRAGDINKVVLPDSTKRQSNEGGNLPQLDDQAKSWESIKAHLPGSPHYAIHLAGLRIEAALVSIAGQSAPPLGMLVRPKYLAEQHLIPEELADASFRLLRIRNKVVESPKFLLTLDIAEDYVKKASELVTALDQILDQR